MAIASANTDIDINFSKNKFTNDVSIIRDANSIRQSVMNIVLTIPGEKPFNRTFGTRLEDSLFDNFNYADTLEIQVEIRKTIERFEPRVQVEDIVLSDTPFNEIEPFVRGHREDAAKSGISDTNQLYVYISYFLVSSAAGATVRDSITVGIKKVR